MKTVAISLPTPRHVQAFVAALGPLEGDFELMSGKYILDARSLMGIMSFDLSKPLELKIYNDNDRNVEAVTPFIAGEERTYEQ